MSDKTHKKDRQIDREGLEKRQTDEADKEKQECQYRRNRHTGRQRSLLLGKETQRE